MAARREILQCFMLLINLSFSVLQLQFCLQSYIALIYLKRRRERAKFMLWLKSYKRINNRKRVSSGRSCWVRSGRTSVWWDNFINNQVSDKEWKENFRMTRSTFERLCEEIGPHIEGKATRMRKPLSVKKQLAVTLYYLSDEGRMRKVANAFGIGKSTVSTVIRRVTKVISGVLGPKYIKHPETEEEVKEMASRFNENHRFPQCIGAIDGTHVGIKKPRENASDFINRKGNYTLNIQACADYRYCFFDVVIKWPGSVHDARIFSNSSLNKKLRDRSIPSCPTAIVDGEAEVPICILGDPAYPLLPFVMKEFANGGKTPQEQFFGYRLSSARMVIECAFGRLKARFGCLKRDMDIDLNDLPAVIHSCFILHNFCEMHNDQVASCRVDAARRFDTQFQPAQAKSAAVNNNESGGKQIRSIFVKYFD